MEQAKSWGIDPPQDFTTNFQENFSIRLPLLLSGEIYSTKLNNP